MQQKEEEQWIAILNHIDEEREVKLFELEQSEGSLHTLQMGHAVLPKLKSSAQRLEQALQRMNQEPGSTGPQAPFPITSIVSQMQLRRIEMKTFNGTLRHGQYFGIGSEPPYMINQSLH